jgi:hypothetical protein
MYLLSLGDSFSIPFRVSNNPIPRHGPVWMLMQNTTQRAGVGVSLLTGERTFHREHGGMRPRSSELRSNILLSVILKVRSEGLLPSLTKSLTEYSKTDDPLILTLIARESSNNL